MKNGFLTIVLACCAVFTWSAGSLAGDVETVQADVQKIADAVYGYDVDTTIAYTYPKIVEMMGGEEQMKVILSSAFEQVKTMGLKLESFEFPAEPTFIDGEIREYVIVPTDSVITADGQRVRNVNFQLGARDKGEQKWAYIEGSRVDEGLLKSLFPDFPADYVFPEVSRGTQ